MATQLQVYILLQGMFDHSTPLSSISAILLQIKLAISNLDPRPARLAHNYNVYVFHLTVCRVHTYTLYIMQSVRYRGGARRVQESCSGAWMEGASGVISSVPISVTVCQRFLKVSRSLLAKCNGPEVGTVARQ
jgi:hypothetical protein